MRVFDLHCDTLTLCKRKGQKLNVSEHMVDAVSACRPCQIDP